MGTKNEQVALLKRQISSFVLKVFKKYVGINVGTHNIMLDRLLSRSMSSVYFAISLHF